MGREATDYEEQEEKMVATCVCVYMNKCAHMKSAATINRQVQVNGPINKSVQKKVWLLGRQSNPSRFL